MFYPYTDSIVTGKSATQPTGNYCISDEDFDLDLNTVIVGAVDANKNLTYRTIKAKPPEVLAKTIKKLQLQLDATNAAVLALMGV